MNNSLYTAQTIPEKAVAEQKTAYTALLQSLGEASFDEIQRAMADRDPVEPENGLTPDILDAIQSQIASRQSTG